MRPPTAFTPSTSPENSQFLTVPAFTPQRPPRNSRVPSGTTLPETVRSCTEAPSPIWRNSPRREPARSTRSPLTLWPPPSNSPAK